jgi:hypothetical protein
MGLLREQGPPADHAQNYRAFIAAVVAAGNWFPVPRALALRLGARPALLLMHIVNSCCSYSDQQGWLGYANYFCRLGTGMAEEEVPALLKRLQQKGLIEVQAQKGKRYVRPVLPRVQAVLDSRAPLP